MPAIAGCINREECELHFQARKRSRESLVPYSIDCTNKYTVFEKQELVIKVCKARNIEYNPAELVSHGSTLAKALSNAPLGRPWADLDTQDLVFCDTEFTSSDRLCQVALVSSTGEILLNAIIDYGKSLEELIAEEKQELRPIQRHISKCTLTKFYGTGNLLQIPRLSPETLSIAIDRLGLYGKWLAEYSTSGHLEYDNLSRCLDTFVPQQRQWTLPPQERVLSLYHLIRRMAHNISPSLTLPVVYVSLFGLSDLLARQHYLADIDAVKTAEVSEALKRSAKKPISSYFKSTTGPS